MDAKEIKAQLVGQFDRVISSLCNLPLSILDGEHHPCPKCGGKKRFNLDRKGTGGAFCNHCQPGTGDVIGTIEWLNGWDFIRTRGELETFLTPSVPVELPPTTRQIRHETHTKLASVVGLSSKHVDDLCLRGLSDAEIDHRGYWSITGSSTIKLMQAFPDRKAIGEHVPGVFAGGSLTINASNCLVIPVRNEAGEIIGAQYRPDDAKPGGAKYLWLSAKNGNGPLSGSPCHFALPPVGKEHQTKVVRLTEGPLKADIATALSGVRTLAIAGVTNWKVGAAGVKLLNPEFVRLAFDADAWTNAGVARSLVDAYDDLLTSGLLVQIESWDAKHKGIDDALAAGDPVEVLSIEDTKKRIDYMRTIKKDVSGQKKIRNFKLVPSTSDNPGKLWDKQPLLAPQIAEKLLEMSGGWPKNCAGQLFVESETKELRRFNDYNQLFGWVGAKIPVEFASGEGCMTKKEFYSELPYLVEKFDDTEEWPHFPPRDGIYYAKKYEPGDGKRLDEFLDFFAPATEYDRELIMAFIATTFWGGSPGRRVCFGIDSIVGTGAGKSELVKRIAKLTGGAYEFDAKEIKEENIRKQLINGEKHRVALLDNVKESCLSSSIIESLVTSDTVSGHRLHVGYGSRPNTITWAITMNGIALSRDLAQRTVIIKLNQPERSGTWDDDVDKFVAKYRDEIIADIAAFFDRPQSTLSRFTRWASWEKAILSRLKNPAALQKVIENRAAESDEDKTTAESIKEYFEEQLRGLGYDPAEQCIHIPSEVARIWLVDSSGKEFTKRSANAYMKQLIDGGSIRNIKSNPCRAYGRGWSWNYGGGDGSTIYTLEKTFEAKIRREEY
jgi:hypothetical protein